VAPIIPLLNRVGGWNSVYKSCGAFAACGGPIPAVVLAKSQELIELYKVRRHRFFAVDPILIVIKLKAI
jgi:hypothetical protein